MIVRSLLINVFRLRVSEVWSGWVDWTLVEELIWAVCWWHRLSWFAEIGSRMLLPCVEVSQLLFLVNGC